MDLVSVVLLTYNSEKTVIEALESVKTQQYKRIELVVSDDCSTDHTIDIIKEWQEQNRDIFEMMHVYQNKHNLGVAGNINGAVKRCSGRYIQLLAGDDMLIENSLHKKVTYCNANHVPLVYTKVELFGKNQMMLRQYRKVADKSYQLFESTKKNQLQEMMKDNWILGPSGGFYLKKFFEDLSGEDERFPLIEDYPFHIKVLNLYGKLPFLNETLHKYRVANGSLSIDRSIEFLSVAADIFFKVKLPIMIRLGMWQEIKSQFLWSLIVKMKYRDARRA